MGILIAQARNPLPNLLPRMSEVKGRTERSLARADLWNLLTNYQPSGIWKAAPPPGGVADALGGGLQEAKRGGRQAGSGAGRRAEGSRAGRRLLRNCFHKTCGCCKTLCFPKTLFPPFSLTYPFFLFTALFPGGGGQGAPGMEASQARSEWLGRSVRGPRTHKVRQRDPPDHLHPDQRTRK